MMKKLIPALVIIVLFATTNAQNILFDWASSTGGAYYDKGEAVTTDAFGAVYITGTFKGTVDFDPGSSTFDLTSNGNWEDIYIQKLDVSGNFMWAVSLGGAKDDYAHSICTDKSGNVYITGEFSETMDADPGSGTLNLTSNGWYDLFVLKLDGNGNFLWAKSFGATYSDYGSSIAIDATGNGYITGTYNGTVDFDPGAGTFNLVSVNNAAFVLKLDGNGNFVWAKSIDEELTSSYAIDVDAAGNAYITGTYLGTIDFDPGAGTANLTSKGSSDLFVLKLDANGDFAWVKGMGASGTSQTPQSIDVTEKGFLYTTGYYEGTVDFDPGSGTSNLTSKGSYDAYIQKLDVNGGFIWARSTGGSDFDYGSCVHADNMDNIYCTGGFNNTVDFDPGTGTLSLTSNGSYDIFVQRLDGNGNFLWASSMGDVNYDAGRSITADTSGNIYVTGEFQGTVDFDPGTSVFNLTASANDDFFVQKLHVENMQAVTPQPTSVNALDIYPNPANQELILSLKETADQFNLRVYSEIGQVVYESSYSNQSSIRLDVSGYSPGLYHVTLYSTDGVASTRFVKE